MNRVRYLFWILPQLLLIFSGCSLLVGNYDPSTVQDGGEQSDASSDGGEQSDIETGPVPIYRSVGVNQSSAVDQASVNTDTLSIASSSAASFGNARKDNVGVGDILVYDSDNNNTIDALAMITARENSTTFHVRATDGKSPTSVTSTSIWAIYRAYTSLNNAFSGTENTGIPQDNRNFDDWDQNNRRDLVTLNATWNIACYAGNIDNTNTSISGWTTDASHYLRVFTPYLPSQVGISQRHKGVWADPTQAYTIKAQSGGAAITSSLKYAKFEGLQIDVPKENSTSGGTKGIYISTVQEPSEISISNCIFRAETSTGDDRCGVKLSNATVNTRLILWNNIIYGFEGKETDVCGVLVKKGRLEAYNNTIANNKAGIIVSGSDQALAINNLFFTNPAGDASGTFLPGTDYNATDAGTIGYSIPGNPTSHDITGGIFKFANYPPIPDYHLTQGSTGAIDLATTPSSPFFTDDIDGENRPYGVGWDIGADEYCRPTLTVKAKGPRL